MMTIQEGGKLNIHSSIPNCYIYSLATNHFTPDINTGKKIAPEYDSFFAIIDIHEFINNLCILLMQQLRIDDLVIDTKNEELKFFSSLQCTPIFQRVNYASKEQIITKKNIEPSRVPNEFDALFIKDEKYSVVPEARLAILILEIR